MYLVIHTAAGDAVEVGVCTDTQCARTLIQGDFKVSERLLALIDEALKKYNMRVADIRAIGVVEGPGPFTSLRVGVAVANTLGYVLAVPVVALPKALVDGAWDEQGIRERIQAGLAKKRDAFDIVTPVYGGEPNITVQKKQAR